MGIPFTLGFELTFSIEFRRGCWIASTAFQARIGRSRWLDLLDRFSRRRRSLLDCYVIPILPTLTMSAKCSHKTRYSLRRRQTRSLLESPSDVRKGAMTSTTRLPVMNSLMVLISPDRPRTPHPLQSCHRIRENLHPCPLQTHLSQSPSTYCAL